MSDFNALISVIRTIVVDTYESLKPVTLVFGSVTETQPIAVLLEQKVPLTSVQLVELNLGEITLEIGDKVALLRQQGGQKYLILNKVVE